MREISSYDFVKPAIAQRQIFVLKNLKAGASKVECRPSALFLLALGLFQNNCFKFKYYNYFDLKQCSGHKVDAVAANPMNHDPNLMTCLN